jgi:hypothetical protein
LEYLHILQTFGIFDDHLVHFVFIWYIFSGLGIMYREKSGNPGYERFTTVDEMCKQLFKNIHGAGQYIPTRLLINQTNSVYEVNLHQGCQIFFG